MKVRVHDWTYESLRRESLGVGVVAVRSLKIIRDWDFVPMYKNDLRYFGSKQQKIYPESTLSKKNKQENNNNKKC